MKRSNKQPNQSQVQIKNSPGQIKSPTAANKWRLAKVTKPQPPPTSGGWPK
jgi:hypothetical protein